MSAPSPSGLPAWFPRAVIALLGLQLGLAWLQGGLLHRQEAAIRELGADLQELRDRLETGGGTYEEDSAFMPLRQPGRKSRLIRIRHQEEPKGTSASAEEPDPARKDLEQARESARKAVQDARKAQSQLSIQENARKADEKAKVEAASSSWHRWTLAAGAVVLVALLGRAWLRRRG